ncbi:voltage-gated chloride channel family protein [Siphonobacter aquaeclarae]|uniref:H+/Cl-antiporter ClcA n=1 Tax=Siphonobacter aquaeclarae TaxID=563176 RepID=A0A1G9IAB8_9BACT|nr:voltage-gated chloride channel family protein [Siphonobacter aquaeclarae]SDL21784.1 H+/Cl-antiporter ClcA [Siphonobacter aquaeclarae]
MKNWLPVFRYLLRWTLLVLPLSVAAGSAVALFLWSLDAVTDVRFAHPWLLYLLPLAGAGIFFLYRWGGKQADAGNNLIIDEIHEPGAGVPLRMAPLVLGTTLITHLFGGSAGREGTAVQIGGSFAEGFARWLRLDKEDRSVLLMVGIAAGFGAVFGTPVTGAVFALEVLTIGRIRHKALMPCFMGAVFADFTCSAWGIHHTHYHIASHQNLPFYTLLATSIGAGVCFGIASRLFSELSHGIKRIAAKVVPRPEWVPVAGGLVVIGMAALPGMTDYLGLGVHNPDPAAVTLVSAFHEGGAHTWSWLWKLLFTAVTLGTGFKGGEVTPLFFIGATLGHTLAVLTGMPVDLFAGLGFIAVFAGATNTPIACTLMGAELFGGEYLLYYAVACFTAYCFSGNTGIYLSQRVSLSKSGEMLPGKTLRDLRK